MTKREMYTTVSIFVIAPITIALIVLDDPEVSYVVSDDGVVSVEGEWRADQPVTIEEIAGGVYELKPDVLTAADPVRLNFDIEDSAQVYWFNDGIEMWEAISSVTQTSRLGRYWVFDEYDLDAPDFVSQHDQLLAMAPSGTVGYEIAVGMMLESGEVIRLDDKGDVGGCGGVVGRGSHHERSQLEHDARVFVNDVETLVHFLFVGEWIVDEFGCGEDKSLENVVE